MRDTRIKVLLHRNLEPHEAMAAIDAAEEFRKFGLRVERAMDADPRGWADLCRQKVYEVVFRSGPISLYGEEPLGRPHYFARVPNDGALLAGLTPHRIFHVDGGRSTELEGFNMYYVGAVVSASGFRPDEGLPYRSLRPASAGEAAEAIRLGMIHELGHSLLGRDPVGTPLTEKLKRMKYDSDGHCQFPGCIMQNVNDYVALLRRGAADRLAFCEGCAYLIEGRINEITYYACA